MDINLFDFYLPEELIAQKPSDKRDHSHLLAINKDKHTYEDMVICKRLSNKSNKSHQRLILQGLINKRTDLGKTV